MQAGAGKLAPHTPDEGQVGLPGKEEEKDALHADGRHLRGEEKPP